MWKTLNSVWFLVIFLNQKAAGYFYSRLKSREGDDCRPRLSPRVIQRFCTRKQCRSIKDCTDPTHRCICDEDCGRFCIDPTSTCTDGWCRNGGICQIVNGSVQCSCPSNFTGKQCDVDVDECTTLSQPCKNGGTCTNIRGGYFCRCTVGWEGADCSININECKTDDNYPVCRNGGTCIDRIGSYKCICPAGKTGLICQYDDGCASNPCSGNATCMISPFGEASCICTSGWTGPNCDVDVKDCTAESSPCHHGGTCRDIPGSYVCDCPSGFSGARCEININECASNPCRNGICLDFYNKFECACHPGWTGKLCDVELNECESRPCKNGGQCLDGRANYSCKCPFGFSGRNCEIDINECESSPCKNGGICQDLHDKYECKCPPGFVGKNCETNVDDCASSPCKNMGLCIDGINKYTCNCHDGYTGTNCQTDIDECQSSPCQNGATCHDKINGYICTCPVGATGDHCENDPDDCPPNACKNGGQCIDGMNSYSCKCHPGFSGSHCDVQIKYCSSSPCRNGGACIDGIAQYQCHCPFGYTGRNCETVVNSCVGHSCRNGASCVSVSAYSYTCTCPAGYSGQYCEKDVNECASKPCVHGTCVDGVNSFMCRCNPGYTGDKCHINIDDCQASPCVQGGTCIDGIDKYTCKCPVGFAGARCEIHIDECKSYPCQHGGTCIDKLGSYSCYCPPGYTGSNCQYPINRCQNNPCRNGATCQRTGVDLSDFHCLCRKGYKGTICDVEEVSCSAAGTSCYNGGTCVDDVNGIQSCKCRNGFDGSYCQTNINDCARGPCKYGAVCRDLIANYTCACQKGFTGPNCDIDINECASNPCVRGTCTDLVDGFLCNCPKGYVGARCEINPNDCFATACFNGGTCKDDIAGYQCSCNPGFMGSRCEIDVDECASNPCKGIGTEKCYNLVDKYHCACKQGFLGRHCEININECLSYPCLNGGTCKDGAGKFTCLCPQGFSGENCHRRVYSCGDTPCENGGTCINYKGRYNCTCKPGVYGMHCEWNKDECLSDPCQNGGTCVDGFNSYTCKCPSGYKGSRCEIIVNECSSHPCQNGGKCRDLVGAYKCDCPEKLVGKNCEVMAKETCPYKDCAKSFDGGRCVPKCNNYACNWDGTTCSLGIHPWSNCTTITSSGRACYEVFDNGVCNKECNTGACLMDGFDCKDPTPSCPHNDYCAKRFADTRCDPVCNNPGCLGDGLDCNPSVPKPVEGTLIIVLLVTPEMFLNGSREFMRELSRVLNTIAFVKKDEDDRPIVKPFPLPPSAPIPVDRKKRSADNVWYISQRGGRYRRAAAEKNGAEVHVELDNRGCQSNCFRNTENAAKYLGAKASLDTLKLPFGLYSVESQDKPTEAPVKTFNPSPLWIAILCVGIPLFIVGVLAGGKRMYTKLWLPEGFPRRLIHQRRTARREPVGQEVSMRSMNKSTSNLEEEGAVGGALSRSDLTPPSETRDAKRVKLEDEDCKKIGSVEKDTRKWTRLHREAADVNVRNCSALTPPQEGERGVDNSVDARGPGGFTALHLASCRGTLLDGCIDDDKDSDDSGGVMVSDLLSLGASYGAKTDESQETPLHLAARYSRADAAKRLLDAGADPNAKDRLGRTPLHLAVGSDAQGVFQILLRNRATDLEARTDDGTTPLILAARFDLVDIVKDLIKAGAKVNNSDNKGKSALHWAASVNSHEVTAELTKNGAKKDLQDEKGQTPLFLGAREGSLEAVRILLVNYANRNIADNMDKTPEIIAKQKMHHDIVQLLTDWSLGCGNSPKAAPAPTSPPDHKSPLNGTTSPPCIEHLQNGNSVVTRFPLTTSARPKLSSTSSSSARGARSKTGNNGGAKRKRRRQPRKEEETHTDSSGSICNTRKSSESAMYSAHDHKDHSPCSSGATFSPNGVSSVANGFSPQGSSGTGISPSNSTTLSPPQDTGSPPVFTDSPFDGVLEEFDDFNVIDFDNIDFNEPDLSTDFGPSDCGVVSDTLSMSCMLPTTVTAIGGDINNSSDCMYHPTRPRRDYGSGLRLISAQSSPNLHCTFESEPRRLTIVADRNELSTVAPRVQNGYPPSCHTSMQAYMSNGMMPTSRKDTYHNHHHLYRQMPQDHSNVIYNENYPTPPSAHSFNAYDSSPQKLPVSYLTPSPDSPEEGWSSSPHSLNSDCSC